MSELTPVERFFGLAASRGPFDLLGLHPGPVDEARVLDALRRRLDRLEQHPYARSLEADEARLALHTAAAQLLDPVVRAHILGHLERDEQGEAVRPVAPPDLTRRDAPPALPARGGERLREFREAAFLLVRGGGGWNRRSMHRVAALAHAYGLTADEVRRAFHMPGAPGVPAAQRARANGVRAGAAPAFASAPAPAPAPDETPRARRAPASPIPAAMGAIVGVGIVIVAAIAVLTPPRRADHDAGAVAPAPPSRTAPDRAPEGESGRRAEPQEEAAPLPIVDASNVFETLSASVALAEGDPGEAAWRFASSVAWIGARWPELSQTRRDEALAGVAAFLHATPAGGAARRRAIEAVGAGAANLAAKGAPAPGALVPGAWSVGVMNALLRDRELDAALLLELRGRIVAGAGPAAPEDASFGAGAVAALRAAVDDLVGDAGGRLAPAEAVALWREWGSVLDALGAGSRAGVARSHALLLDTVERLLLEGPSPADDAPSRIGLAVALSRLEWGPAGQGPGARASGARLLAWLGDEAIPTRDLAVVTEWLATEAGAPGVTFAMVVPRNASRETRAAYRDRYAEAWGLTAGARASSVEASWASAARAEHGRVGRDVGVAATIARAVILSRLNEAARLRWGRAGDEARALIEDPARGVDAALAPNSAGIGLDPPGRDGAWVVDFLSGPANETARMAALERLANLGGALSRTEGDVLAEVALFGAPAQVRERARWLVREHVNDPALVNGVLEALTRAPRTRQAAELIEEVGGAALPSPDDPDFELGARRALVARLLELLAGEGELGAIDRLAVLLGASYAARAGIAPAPARGGAPAAIEAPALDAPPPTAREAAEALRAVWQREASRYTPNPYAPRSLDEIHRRRDARLRLADGVVQAFVAEQAAILELMAAVVAAERPDAIASIEGVLTWHDDAWRTARHIGQQVESGEDAMLQLWALRLGETPLTPAPGGSAAQ